MFRSNWTILREHLLSLAKVTILWKQSVKVHRYMLCGVVVANISGCDVCTACRVVCDCSRYREIHILCVGVNEFQSVISHSFSDLLAIWSRYLMIMVLNICDFREKRCRESCTLWKYMTSHGCGHCKKHVCPFEGKELHTDRLVRDGLSRRNFYCLE